MTDDDDVLVHENGTLIPAKVTGISDMELQGLRKIFLFNQVLYYRMLSIYSSTTPIVPNFGIPVCMSKYNCGF